MCAHARMNVGVGSEVVVAMTQPCLNVFERVAKVEHDRCATMPQVVKTNGAQSIFIEDIKKDDHFKRKWSSFFYAEQPVC